MLDLDPFKWRRPRRVTGMAQHLARFRAAWAPYDWTRELAAQGP